MIFFRIPFLFTLCLSFLASITTTLAQDFRWPLVEREIGSSYLSPKSLKRSIKFWEKRKLHLSIHENQTMNLLAQGKISSQELLAHLFTNSVIQNEIDLCTNDDESKKPDCQKNIIESAIHYIRGKLWIDDTAVLIIFAYLKQNRQQLGFLESKKLDLLGHYENTYSLKKLRERNNLPLEKSFFVDQKYKSKLKPWGKITPRQELLLNYHYYEIKILTELIERTEKRMQAQNICIQVDYEGDGEVDEQIEIDSAEKYRFAQKMLTIEKDQASHSQGFLAGHYIKDMHLLMAASEIKVPENIITELMKFPGIKWKKEKKGEIYLKALWSIGKTALISMPGGIYFVLPIIAIETYFQTQKMKDDKNAPTIF